MKTYIYSILFAIVLVFANACNIVTRNASDVEYVTVSDGAGNDVEVFTGLLPYYCEGYDTYFNADDVEGFVDDQFRILKVKCNNPRTFVPEAISHLSITDSVIVRYANHDITLYTYECWVRGHAKNSFGVEGDVDMHIGNELWDYSPRFVVKNDFGNNTGYDVTEFSSEVFGNIPFEYNGKTYYLQPYLNTDEWVEKVCSL